MVEITNPKIQKLLPLWKTFKGFSLLFDHPREEGLEGKLIHTHQGNPDIQLMYGLRDAIEEMGNDDLILSWGLCPLPFPTYHITCWDGVNQKNIGQINDPEAHSYFEKYLDLLPHGTLESSVYGKMLHASELLRRQDWNISFVLDQLHMFEGSKALVAKLRPKGSESEQNLAKLKEARSLLYQAFGQKLGMEMDQAYEPHITLGYFIDISHAEQARSQLPVWDKIAQEKTADLDIQVDRMSLYNFEDMVTFRPGKLSPRYTTTFSFPPQLEALVPLISACPASSIAPREFFISWNGVPTLAYNGFPATLLDLKKQIDTRTKESMYPLKSENAGSKWPKTTLGCLRDDAVLQEEDLQKMRDICDRANLHIDTVDSFEIKQLQLVLFQGRSLEKRWLSFPIDLDHKQTDTEEIPLNHLQEVDAVLADFAATNLDNYWPFVQKYGNREAHYRGLHTEATLVYEFPHLRANYIQDFQRMMDEAFPGKYTWFEPHSLHITIRALS